MTRQIVLHRQSQPENFQTSNKKRFAEVAGGTTAACAAVCCCFPCGLLNLLVLTMYKLPKGICRKALKKMKKKKRESQKLREKSTCDHDPAESQVHPVSLELWSLDNSNENNDDDLTAKRVLELEKEMWNQFFSTGFWRSSSQSQKDLEASPVQNG